MKCYAYERVSGKSQAAADKDGLPRQRAAAETWAKATGATIVEHFEEKGVCGEDEWNTRPAFSDMIGRILDNGVKTIVVENLSRLARAYVVQEHILIWLATKGITLIAADSGEDITAAIAQDPMKKLLIQMQGILFEFEKNSLVRKLKAARQRKKSEDPTWREGRLPFGARPGEQDTIDRMKRLARKRPGFRPPSNASIAATLDFEGRPTRTGKPWAAETVRKILMRERNKK